MSVHSIFPKKAELIISNASHNGSIGLDEILELAHHIGDYHKTTDSSGRKVISYVLWKVLLGYYAKYDGEPMAIEESANLVRMLQPTGKVLNYLQGNIELEPDAVIKLAEMMIDAC